MFRELNNVFMDRNINFDEFKDEHCCKKFCSYYRFQPFSLETGLRDAPTSLHPLPESEGNSSLKNTIRFNKATKGKGRAEPEVDNSDNFGSSWNKGVVKKIFDVEQKWRDASASTSTVLGGYTKGMDLSL